IGNEYDTRFGAEAGALHAFDLSGYLPVDAAPPPEPTAALVLTATPNPARGPSDVRLLAGTAGPARVAVLDALGRTVAVLHVGPLAAGSHRFSVPGGLPAGVYVVRADVGGASATVRLSRVR
ncbi:MAG: T9SS type A sorting domain-containing protein, partial [Demequina sp.]